MSSARECTPTLRTIFAHWVSGPGAPVLKRKIALEDSLMMSLPMRQGSLEPPYCRSPRFGTPRNRTLSLKHPDAIGNAVLPQRAAVQCPNVGI